MAVSLESANAGSPLELLRDVFAGADGSPTKTGWLLKKGEKRHNWSCRWFVLTATKLQYFDEHSVSAKLKGELDLAALAEIRRSTHPKAELFEIELQCRDEQLHNTETSEFKVASAQRSCSELPRRSA